MIDSPLLPTRAFLIATLNKIRLTLYEDQSNDRAGDWVVRPISAKKCTES